MQLTKETILDYARAKAAPFGLQEIAGALSAEGKMKYRLKRLLGELEEKGELERIAGARYRIPGANGDVGPGLTAPVGAEEARTGSIEARTGAELGSAGKAKPGAVGQIRVHPAGYGFVVRDDGEADVFIPARFRGDALDGDRVRVSTWSGHKGTEGRVEAIESRGRAKLTGTVKMIGRQVVLEPDDPRIASNYGHVMLEGGAGGAPEGACVVVEITTYPTRERPVVTARVSHVLGEVGDPRTEVAKVIACADIPDTFPDDVVFAASQAPSELRPQDFADRVDMRDRAFLTIDPETARDFDDAIFVEDRAGGSRVWVAVADVSHYVTPRHPFDREALVRGCSVYLPDRAIPMLPPELSAEICSLKPEQDRCAMVVRMDVDNAGVVIDTAFCAAVIRSHARLDYPGAAAALAGDFRGPRARYREWAPDIARMNALAQKMRARRRERGALDFDLPEAAIILDEDDPRLVRDVRRQKASADVKVAYQLVEEFMVAANEAVARYFHSRGLDSVYRVHGLPDAERLEDFARMAESMGERFLPEEAQSPRGLQRVLSSIAGKPYERALNFLLLRSLKQATYDVTNVGHFGLASKEYLHFTSPIRRYPDLIVHRLLKYHLRKDGQPAGGLSAAGPPTREQLQSMAADSSAHERRAALAEREVVDMYRAFLMRDRVGDELEGIISGVTNFGLFVEIQEPFIEGLVRLERLSDDFYEFDEQTLRLSGRRSGRTFTLGMPVSVRVEDVSVARRRIDFSLHAGGVENVPLPRAAKRGQRRSFKEEKHGRKNGSRRRS